MSCYQGNGKRLVDPTKVALEDYEKDQVIPLHPNFQMWVLANRPGFPFLGNNFFREIGDIFASQYVCSNVPTEGQTRERMC